MSSSVLHNTPSCLWLCLFCPYFYSWIRQAFRQSHEVCLFGYSQLQRGYRYYSPDTHRYFVSTNVTFFDNSSMFHINHPPSSDVISLPLLYPVPNTYTSTYSTSTIASLYSSPAYDIGPPTDSSSMTPPPPQHRSYRLPLIFPLPFGKVFVPLITSILFMIS